MISMDERSIRHIEETLQALFGGAGFTLVADGRFTRPVIENGMGLLNLRARCHTAVADAPQGSGAIVLIRVEQTGLARLTRWLLLPFQVSIASRAMVRHGTTILGRFAVFPDITEPNVVYQLGSPAQRYAERSLIPRLHERALVLMVRKILTAWAGCDPSVGAIVIVGAKP
jgi:hypothetical protein